MGFEDYGPQSQTGRPAVAACLGGVNGNDRGHPQRGAPTGCFAMVGGITKDDGRSEFSLEAADHCEGNQ
jgi:hypothetical protein